ncbi:MAG TPA: iron uptake transporter deferrochelatase/peroxidase subunit [Rugosimonospora sp.]|nr:iron uptake transporter deferrochelatase/peroxidase subunit [Rugosimonospora sp.]
MKRRSFIKGATAGVAGAAAVAGIAVAATRTDAATPQAAEAPPELIPFHGAHQAGVFTPPQRAGAFAVFDVTASKADLPALFQMLAGRSRMLATGGSTVDLGVGAPPADSDVVGPFVPSDGLTITVGVGASLFDQRFGLASKKPAKLTAMTTFPNDTLDPAWCHGDLVLQICANNVDVAHHALRDLTKHTRGAMQLRYRMNGFQSPPRPTGTQRNLMGFKDGIANPKEPEADKLVWVQSGASGEPAWTAGGTYMVVRMIRMLVEFWDRVSLSEQEKMFGRKRDTGAPLDGAVELDAPRYANDPKGDIIPLDSHIRMANPRTAATDLTRLLRRGYNYDRGVDLNGNLDVGLIFAAFMQDIARQFEATQKRLIDEPLVDYIQPYGGGYFFAFPGLADAKDWYGRTMFA